jgi:hypothetical protein
MAFDYAAKFPPIGQFDKNACWAASISWWLKVMAHGFYKRKWLTQSELIQRFNSLCDENGALQKEKFRTVCEDAEVRITLKYISPASLQSDYPDLDSPVILVFNYPKIGGTHMNVIFNREDDKVQCMEPYFPYPGQDGKRTGQIVTRPLNFFGNSEQVGIGYLPLGDKAAE